MSRMLSALRAEAVEPLFERVRETIDLERDRNHGNTVKQDTAVADDLAKLSQVLNELDESDRQAILAVFRHEVGLLVLACILKADIMALERKARLG